MSRGKGEVLTPFGLKAVAQALDLTQRRVAELVGRHEDWVARIWRGDHLPSWSSAVNLAQALNVPLAVFIPGHSERADWLGAHGVEDNLPVPTHQTKESGRKKHTGKKKTGRTRAKVG